MRAGDRVLRGLWCGRYLGHDQRRALRLGPFNTMINLGKPIFVIHWSRDMKDLGYKLLTVAVKVSIVSLVLGALWLLLSGLKLMWDHPLL